MTSAARWGLGASQLKTTRGRSQTLERVPGSLFTAHRILWLKRLGVPTEPEWMSISFRS